MDSNIDLSQIRTSQDALKSGLPIFKVLSDGAIKAYKGDDGKRRFSLTASSDATDLAGDCFTEKSLNRMWETADGMTMFLNHSYNVPGDVFGSVEKATLERKKVFNRVLAKEVEYLCLTYDGIVTEVNPIAVQTHDMMLEGVVMLGGSVSVLITEKSQAKDGRRMIEDVINLECSIIGLPCNPTSWVVRASKALKIGENPHPLADMFDHPGATDKACPKCQKMVDTLHDFTRSGCPHCKWLATPDQVHAALSGALDSALEAGTKSSDPAVEEAVVEVEEKTMAEGYTYKVAKKGMFNDILEMRESSIYHLTDVLCSALWSLWSIWYWDRPDDMDLEAELSMICDEFKEVAMARLLPLFRGDDDDDSADKTLARLKAASNMIAVLGRTDVVAKAITEIADKAGRRNSDSDQKMIDSIHSIIVDLGAECTESKATPVTSIEPVADKTASQAGEQVDKAMTEQIETLRKQLAQARADAEELGDVADIACKAAEVAVAEMTAAVNERNDALDLVEQSLKALESYGLQPIGR